MWRKSIILTIGKSSEAIVQLAISMVIARLLNLDQIGIYRELLLYCIFISLISSYAIPELFIHIIPRIKINQNLDFIKWLKKGLFINLILALVFSVVMALSTYHSELGHYTILLIIPFTLYSLGTVFFNSVTNGHIAFGEEVSAIKISLLRILLNSLSVVVFIVLYYLPVLYFTSTSLLMLIVGGLIFNKFLKKDELKNAKANVVSSSYYRNYAIALLSTNIVFYLSINLDKYIVSFFFNSEDYAIFSSGKFQIPFIGILITSVMSVTIPKLSEYFHSGQLSKFADTWRKQIKDTTTFYIFIFFFVYYFSKEIILLVYGIKFIESVPIFQISLLKYLITVTSFGVVFSTVGQPKITLIWSLLYVILTGVLSAILIPFIGYKGAVWASTAVFFFSPFYFLFFVKKNVYKNWKDIFPISFYLKNLIICSIIWFPFIYFSRNISLSIKIPLVIFPVFLNLVLFEFLNIVHLRPKKILKNFKLK